MLIKNNFINLNKNTLIIPYMVGNTYELYNGNKYISIKINEQMLGYFLGEFIFTRKVGKIHKLKKTKSGKGIKK